MAKNHQNLPKRWFSDGPAMSFSARYRAASWLANLVLYALLNMFYLRMQTGFWVPWQSPGISELLIDQLLSPPNIFYFPTQIIVIALVMALLCAVPIIIAQFYNLLYAVPFVLAVLFLGQNQVLSLCLFVSCAAVSFDPFRFKSKFVAAVMCLLPEILYCILFSGPNPEQDALRWAVLYAPWSLAFLVCVIIIGIVIAIGHFVRYRPGVLMPIFGLFLAGSVLLFHLTIGMQERDFQDQVYSNNPDQIAAFQNRNIIPLLEKELAQRLKNEPFLETETVRDQIRRDWRQAFLMTRMGFPLGIGYSTPATAEVLNISQAQVEAIDQLDNFINNCSAQDKRLPDAHYYKALLIDISVDLRALRDEDFLRFSYEIPRALSETSWRNILKQFPDSPVSIEARWRLARLWAAQKPRNSLEPYRFDQALELLEQAWRRCNELIQQRTQTAAQESFSHSFLGEIFRRPPPPLTNEQLASLQLRIGRLMTLINIENRSGLGPNRQRLAEFVGLDKLNLNYEARLKELLLESPQPDPLIDNIELALVMLTKDTEEKKRLLEDLARRYEDHDGGVEAMLELAQIYRENYDRSDYPSDRDVLRSRSAELLQKIITLRPDDFLGQYAQKLLEELPPVK
ncbi:tol-pal system YbgF family protein [Planctomycetota bacterium]